MSIDAITARIVNDATEYADGIISDAKGEAEKITGQAGREAEAIREQSAAQSAKDTVTIINRKKSMAELEARKMQLAVKQQEFTCAIEVAIDHIANMEPKAYTAFLAAKIAETGIREGELLLNPKDKNAIGGQLAAAANEALHGGKLVLSDKTINAKGGFVLKHGAMEINSTVETMVHSVKEKVAAEVVAALFQA